MLIIPDGAYLLIVKKPNRNLAHLHSPDGRILRRQFEYFEHVDLLTKHKYPFPRIFYYDTIILALSENC